MQYWQKLQDPRWQRKRMEIMSRDNWKCRCCGDGSKTLNVHHRFYVKGKEPWDYMDTVFITLCSECHLESHYTMDALKHHWDDLTSQQKDEFLSLVIYAATGDAAVISQLAQKLINKNMRGIET